MRAYVDESVHVVGAPKMYILASVVVRHAQTDEVRAVVRDSLGNRRDRFHWANEKQPVREAMAQTVGGLELFSVVAVCTPIDNKRQERARRLCLTQLLWELDRCGVQDILLESRGQQDRNDREYLRAQQRAGTVTSALRYGFGDPKQEPLLWLPDLVAGAVADNRTSRTGRGDCLTLLGPGVRTVEVGTGT